MAVKYCTFSNDLKAKDLSYSDDFFTLKGEKVIPSDSFSFDTYYALKDVNDFKTNNLSNLFLTNKQENHNWLQANVKQEDKLNGLATTLSWYTYNSDNQDEKGSWLYFAKNYQMFDINVSQVECLVTYGKNENDSNYIFYLEFLDQNTCRISHTFGDLVFYLCIEDDKKIHFSKNIDGEKQVFIYNIDDNIMKLYKRINHKKYNVIDQVIGSYNRLYLLGIQRDAATGEASLQLKENLQDSSSDTLIYINQNELMFDYYLDGSWVSYNRNKYISSIDRDRSVFGLKTQALLHHEYNKDEGINFIPLKNNLTYKGNSIKGSYMSKSAITYPDVNYRTYNSINSGIRQEKGTDTIILTYTFSDQQYEINQGQDLYFTIPQKSIETSNLLDPLWPYVFINLNDTKFVKNGAFGSNVPFFSDKFSRLQNYKTVIKNQEGEKIQPNNETYLCSWLYKPTHEAQPMWLDRYYYPDMISRRDALLGDSAFDYSFENIIDKNYNTDSIRQKIHKQTYFDKKSDVMIHAGNTYRYQRISKDAIDQVVNKLNQNAITTSKNESNKTINLENLIQFNNETYRKLDYKDWNRTNKINFNGDFYLQRDKRMGIQIFGTDFTNGFNIQNRKDLVPFHYYATDKILYLCNNKFEIVHQFNLYEKYNDYILKLFLGDVFDDIIILSGIWLYILSYDLRLKSRINLTATSDNEDELQLNAIKDLGKLVLNEKLEGITKLINYPYNDTHISLNSNYITDSQTIQFTEWNKSDNQVKIESYLISINQIQIDQNTVNEGFINIPSNLCELMCRQNPKIYKNNLYVPLNQNIMKIIFCPDCQNDFNVFPQSIRQDYPAVARILKGQEFYTNYMKTNNSESDMQRLGTQQGFIEVQNIIKHIHFDKDGKLYGLNFDQYGVAADGDTLYGLYAMQNYINSGGWWWLFNQSLSKMKTKTSTSKYAEFASPNSIDMVKLNEKGQMCLIRNFNNIISNNNPDNEKRLEIYDITKERIYTYDLSSYDKVISLDAYNYINEAHEQVSCFCILCEAYGAIFKIQYFSGTNDVSINRLNIPEKPISSFIQTVNTNALLRYRDYNVLYFNLHVPSNYIYNHVATIKWVLDDIQNGWYNINVSVDLEKAEFIVRINDEIHQIVNEESHSWFKPYESADGNLFTTTYYVGILGKKYGSTLNNLLKNSPYDPYACKNLMIENLLIHNKTLSYYEYLAMRLRNTYINKLILTLPCGMRNNIDELVRYFKYNVSPSISNKVKINISGTGLSTQGEFNLLRKEIMAALENNTDCLMTVKEIEFIQNE